jgi:hypothetical protein
MGSLGLRFSGFFTLGITSEGNDPDTVEFPKDSEIDAHFRGQ